MWYSLGFGNMIRIGINGFGRIGRCLLRAYSVLPTEKKDEMEIVAINSNGIVPEDAAHLLQYDSTHGRFTKDVRHGPNWIGWIDEDGRMHKIQIVAHSAIEDLKWREYGAMRDTDRRMNSMIYDSRRDQTPCNSMGLDEEAHGVDIVMECTGVFNSKEEAEKHIKIAGAKKVIVSAPCADADMTVVLGVNEASLDCKKHKIISIGSCTTNCLAPIAKALHDAVGIESGFMTTIHSYTSDQQLLDNRHNDRRRARSAALSMIPTSTGAAKTIGDVIPSLKGRLDGAAIRVPTSNVSMIDLTFVSDRDVTVDIINKAVLDAAMVYPNIIAMTNKELVSIDFNGSSYSAIFDMTQTKVVHNRFVRIAAWYDNEWGFVNRMLGVAMMLV